MPARGWGRDGRPVEDYSDDEGVVDELDERLVPCRCGRMSVSGTCPACLLEGWRPK